MKPDDKPNSYNQRFREISRRFPKRVAFRMKTPDGYSEAAYEDVHRKASAVARHLVARGVRPGDRVAVLSENRPEWVVAYLGILLARGVVVPLDAQISPSEWRRLIDDSESLLVFTGGLQHRELSSALEGSPVHDGVICFDPVEGAAPFDRFIGEEGLEASALPEAGLSDAAVIIYTSGTTGKPKGVVLTHDNIVSDIVSILEIIEVDENEVFLCLLPLHHVFASVISFLTPLFLGAQVVFADTLKRSEILQALQEAGISILATVPQFFYLFHDRIEQELAHKPLLTRKIFRLLMRANHHSLRILHLNFGKILFSRIHRSFGSRLRIFVSGGASFDPKVAQDFYDLGFTILQGYGLTETTGACCVTRIEENVVGSVGKPLPGVEIRIVDAGEGGVGEVAIRGPIVMEGYYRNPEATAEAMRDGWFHSGDLGRMDPRGNLFITGRKKEVIVLPNGKNIYPDEIEAHYGQSPYIKEIAVVGIAERGGHESGERLHAVVVPDFDYMKEKKIANAREILRDEIGRLSNQLPHYKRLMSYQIQKDPLPRTTTRKIKRLELKRLVETGALKDTEAGAPEAKAPEQRAILESPVGQEVAVVLREGYHRDTPIEPDLNLELDLGFDSMERVELLASLEQSLGLALPEDFGADIYTVRDLISGLEKQAGGRAGKGGAARESWGTILSAESLSQEGDWRVQFSGKALTVLKYLLFRLLHLPFRMLLRLEARGLENLPAGGAFLICPNHLSFIDPLVLLSVLPYRVFRRIFFVGASDFFEGFFMRMVARLSNTFPVDPDAHLLRAMKVGAYGLRRDRILCIFPEGARSFDGSLQEFKKGAAILSREVGVPMVPVAIQGTYEVLRRGSSKVRFHKVKLVFGKALSPSSEDGEDPYRTDTERLRAAVAGLLQQ